VVVVGIQKWINPLHILSFKYERINSVMDGVWSCCIRYSLIASTQVPANLQLSAPFW
jgi:hypothetical protein